MESMERFAGMIMRGMSERGHKVELWTSRQIFGRLPIPSAFVRKWLGYADQYLIFPRELHQQVSQQPDDTLFVVTDQALGMWVPHLSARPHVIHCHDFNALKSALGEFPENPTRWTGRQYQRLIWRGFSHGKAFISISKKTRDDLHRFLPSVPKISKVVHNGLNHPFRPMDLTERVSILKQTGVEIPENGCIVHVGGNQWYKNRTGVLEIYRTYATCYPRPSALWMIGSKPTHQLLNLAASIPSPGKVYFLSGLTNEQVNAAYAYARVLLFPSLEEGFGWPIVEAMASDCPVITTDRVPMTEVAGGTARLISRMPTHQTEREMWARSTARIVDEVVRLEEGDRRELLQRGRLNATRFETETVLMTYEEIYSQAMSD